MSNLAKHWVAAIMAIHSQLIVNLSMELDLKVAEFLPNFSLEGNLEILKGQSILIFGANGVGKSSLLQYFKLKAKDLFSSEILRFVDQPRLDPLNEVSFSDVVQQLAEQVGNDSETKRLYEEFFPIISPYSQKPLKELSGGQNQMAKILLGIFLGGDIFFFDEPSQSLDDDNIKNFSCCLEGLKRAKKACVIIEHQSGLIKSLCHKSFEMRRVAQTVKLEVVDGN